VSLQPNIPYHLSFPEAIAGVLGTRLINRSPCISSFVHSNADFAPNFSSSGIDAAHLSQLLADVFVNNGRVSRLDVLLSCFPAVLESFVRASFLNDAAICSRGCDACCAGAKQRSHVPRVVAAARDMAVQ
jgi:hypothetical protein